MKSTSPKTLIVVVGPTAVGKTNLCIQLAQHLQTEIVSADARQCYHGMAIGTAQPTTAERQTIPHHLIDFLPVQTSYSAGRFEHDVLALLDQLFTKYDQVLMTGGSGMYLQAACEGLDSMPPVDTALRDQLNARLQQEGVSALANELAALDPAYYQLVDRQNPRRVVRALEVIQATGQPYAAFRKKIPQKRPFRIIKIGLTRDRQVLYQRIDQRVAQMWAQGLLAEATALYPYKSYNALQTVGYREIFGYLEGRYDQQEAISLLKRNTRRYAKRQMTWFKRDAAIRWFHPDHWAAIRDYAQAPYNG
ncbi:MAG: tRNA (adenosine(37)-N6)-dimethylallyltransferase MiaA [Bacteroidota bacterium]